MTRATGCASPSIVASASFVRSAELLGQAAGTLERAEEEAHYLHLAAHVRDAFNFEYATPAGRVMSDSGTAYALALQFALLPDAAPSQDIRATATFVLTDSSSWLSLSIPARSGLEPFCWDGRVQRESRKGKHPDALAWILTSRQRRQMQEQGEDRPNIYRRRQLWTN